MLTGSLPARDRAWPALLRCRRGAPAIEFALVGPVLLAMFMGIFDVGQALINMRRLTLGAQEVAEAAATFAATTAALGVISTTQANAAMSIATANFTQWLDAGNPGYGITLSSVAIVASPTNCTSGCTYAAQTAWSLALNGGQPVLRACGDIATVPDTAAPSLTTLPVGLLYPPAILVVDLSTVYQPTFSGILTGPIKMMRTAYIPPRAPGPTSYVAWSPDGASYTGHKCSGYP
jgi:Flp pilus assembly protein TadG